MMFWDDQHQLKPVFPDLMSRWIITFDSCIREFKVIQPDVGELNILIDTQPVDVEDQFLDDLKASLLHHLKEYRLNATIQITRQELTYPADNGKFKRFEVRAHLREKNDVGK